MNSLKVQVEEQIVADNSEKKKTEWRLVSELKVIVGIPADRHAFSA